MMGTADTVAAAGADAYLVKPCLPEDLEVDAVAVDGRWNADVRIRRTLSEEKPHVERVSCYKVAAELARRCGRGGGSISQRLGA